MEGSAFSKQQYSNHKYQLSKLFGLS